MTVEPSGPMTTDKRARASAYRWLAGVFAREMPAETVAIYRSPEGLALLDALEELSPLAAVVQALRARMETEVSNEQLARDLASTFARLFHGAAGRRSAPPCASFYLSETARMMQADAGHTRASLDALDLQMSDEMREPPDHISVQLAVMAHLAETADDSTQADWLENRLLTWIDAFASRCAQAPQPDIYASVARAAAKLCDADFKELQDATAGRARHDLNQIPI